MWGSENTEISGFRRKGLLPLGFVLDSVDSATRYPAWPGVPRDWGVSKPTNPKGRLKSILLPPPEKKKRPLLLHYCLTSQQMARSPPCCTMPLGAQAQATDASGTPLLSSPTPIHQQSLLSLPSTGSLNLTTSPHPLAATLVQGSITSSWILYQLPNWSLLLLMACLPAS